MFTKKENYKLNFQLTMYLNYLPVEMRTLSESLKTVPVTIVPKTFAESSHIYWAIFKFTSNFTLEI